jgi:hypothetical protein
VVVFGAYGVLMASNASSTLCRKLKPQFRCIKISPKLLSGCQFDKKKKKFWDCKIPQVVYKGTELDLLICRFWVSIMVIIRLELFFNSSKKLDSVKLN